MTIVEEITSIEDLEKCIRQSVLDVRKTVKSLSSQLKEETFFVKTVLETETK